MRRVAPFSSFASRRSLFPFADAFADVFMFQVTTAPEASPAMESEILSPSFPSANSRFTSFAEG